MKTIGIIGGMSWESTIKYYQWLNEGIRDAKGGLNSARIILSSLNFAEIEVLQKSGSWDEAGRILAAEAKKLESAGADFLILATNTMHKVADQIEAAVNIPFLHLADATADKIKAACLTKVGLMATAYTMEQDFYIKRLDQRGITVIVPTANYRQSINNIIFNELCQGQEKQSSKLAFMRAARSLLSRDAEGPILGCMEINMLIDQTDFDELVFDTARIHIDKGLELALK